MPSIFEGIDEYIDTALDVRHIGTKAPHYARKRSALIASRPDSFDCAALLRKMAERIEKNWAAALHRTASAENWRWEKKTYRSDRNTSKEKILEKRIATQTDLTWVNQIPTTSGLLNSTEGKLRSIDLAHQISVAKYEFIELKWGSDTPLFAAFEILKYGLLYLFSRQHAVELGYLLEEKPLLRADAVALIVLAPSGYYGQYLSQTKWLGEELNAALNYYNPCSPLGVRMTFRFEQLRCDDPASADINALLSAGRAKLHL
jgi:hypothetical protein